MPSLVSANDMPAVNSAGNTRIDQIDNPVAASVAEIPSRPISVAVSKPRPNKNPSGYLCQLLVIMRNSGRKSSTEQIAGAAKAYRVSYARVATGDGGNYLMDHSSIVYLMDLAGRLSTFFPPDTTSERIADALRQLLAGS
jgi:hypothetical protein